MANDTNNVTVTSPETCTTPAVAALAQRLNRHLTDLGLPVFALPDEDESIVTVYTKYTRSAQYAQTDNVLRRCVFPIEQLGLAVELYYVERRGKQYLSLIDVRVPNEVSGG